MANTVPIFLTRIKHFTYHTYYHQELSNYFYFLSIDIIKQNAKSNEIVNLHCKTFVFWLRESKAALILTPYSLSWISEIIEKILYGTLWKI